MANKRGRLRAVRAKKVGVFGVVWVRVMSMCACGACTLLVNWRSDRSRDSSSHVAFLHWVLLRVIDVDKSNPIAVILLY